MVFGGKKIVAAVTVLGFSGAGALRSAQWDHYNDLIKNGQTEAAEHYWRSILAQHYANLMAQKGQGKGAQKNAEEEKKKAGDKSFLQVVHL